MMSSNFSKFFLLTIGLYFLSGCAATHVAVSKRNLDVQTKMSASLFVEPIENEKLKKVYIQAKNTSDKQEFRISHELEQAFAAKGFKVVSKMNQANFVVQVNILQVGKMDPSAAEASVYRGYGTDGIALGASSAYLAGGDSKQMVGAGILGGLASVVADSVVKDVHFSVITDVQIKERLNGQGKVETTSLHHNQSGTSGHLISKYSEKTNWKVQQTRILSSANKMNLDFNEAAPRLQTSLVQSIVNIF
ncbi:complement resistance protein TraT [Bdellovibrio reynosensis]|uniref:Complement resistance protein TraT n=1 Tax=Bdellovibrio reynosensis TaxID=2835041 RepID=A0ABY4CB47_9BACT|nr:complement resistance protein TraT [Bdellovibrio reynosensis]UOF02196.1 complement resistance protein TraT [Bdellovibrio reynosensis]